MARYAMAIAYDYCTGCHTCEVSCKMENNIPLGQWGIKINEVGPWEYGNGKWQDDCIPAPTKQCTKCVARLDRGKKPLCVHNCYTNCMKFGLLQEVLKEIDDEEKKFGQAMNHVIYLMKED